MKNTYRENYGAHPLSKVNTNKKTRIIKPLVASLEPIIIIIITIGGIPQMEIFASNNDESRAMKAHNVETSQWSERKYGAHAIP